MLYMKLNKKTLKQIWKLNEIYNNTFIQHQKYWWKELLSKMKLIRVIAINLEEQKRWFLKSSLPYDEVTTFFIENQNLSFSDLHKQATKTLLWIDL